MREVSFLNLFFVPFVTYYIIKGKKYFICFGHSVEDHDLSYALKLMCLLRMWSFFGKAEILLGQSIVMFIWRVLKRTTSDCWSKQIKHFFLLTAMENFSDDTADAYFLGFKYLMQFKPQINNWIHVVIFTVFFFLLSSLQ